MRYVSIGILEFHCSVGVDFEGSRFHFSVSFGLNFIFCDCVKDPMTYSYMNNTPYSEYIVCLHCIYATEVDTFHAFEIEKIKQPGTCGKPAK
jgi:hypothetical protein